MTVDYLRFDGHITDERGPNPNVKGKTRARGSHRTAVVRIYPLRRLTFYRTHNSVMPMGDTPKSGMPAGALPMLILRVLQSGSLHGYALAQRIHVLSSEVLAVEEGLLYPYSGF